MLRSRLFARGGCSRCYMLFLRRTPRAEIRPATEGLGGRGHSPAHRRRRPCDSVAPKFRCRTRVCYSSSVIGPSTIDNSIHRKWVSSSSSAARHVQLHLPSPLHTLLVLRLYTLPVRFISPFSSKFEFPKCLFSSQEVNWLILRDCSLAYSIILE